MKRYLLFVMVFQFGLLSYSQDDGLYLEWQAHTTFDTLRSVGHRHTFYQYCVGDIDSLIANGTVAFADATVANVTRCKYETYIKDTVVERIMLLTDTKKNTEELRTYVKQLCGELKFVKHNKRAYIFLTACELNEKNCIVMYIENKNRKKGRVIIMHSPV